ncbi:MAG: outer membrane protein [Rhizomicrobium sp.]
MSLRRAALAGLFLATPPLTALADPYLGFDLDAAALDLAPGDPATYPQSLLGVGAHGGYRFDNFAGELGYSTVRGEMTPDNIRLNQLTLDGLYYVPVGGFLSLLFTGGAADTNYGDSTFTTSTYQANGTTKSVRQGNTVFGGNEFDWRAGAGLSFSLTDGYEVHFITRYQPLSMNRVANYQLSLNVGVNFYF